MSKKIFLLVGVVAVIGLFAVSSYQQKSTFLFSNDLDDIQQEFINFLATYAKYYNSHDEFNYRFQIFKENLELVNSYDDGSTVLGLNQFSDMSDEEWRAGFKSFGE